MTTIDTLLQVLGQSPTDAPTWLALADALEEDDQNKRAELIRLQTTLNCNTDAKVYSKTGEFNIDPLLSHIELSYIDLLISGVEPCVPQVTNSIGMKFSLVPPGKFWMGSSLDGVVGDMPRHEVHITKPFYFGVYTVTIQQYERLCATSRVGGQPTNRLPARHVSWYDASEFCDNLGNLAEEKAAGRTYRLPTEAEWEYACRWPLISPYNYNFGGVISAKFANYGKMPDRVPARYTVPVHSYTPNGLGLYQMHGNVNEWCFDSGMHVYYYDSPSIDPVYTLVDPYGPTRILRGGGYCSDLTQCRSTSRVVQHPAEFGNASGFRVVMCLQE